MVHLRGTSAPAQPPWQVAEGWRAKPLKLRLECRKTDSVAELRARVAAELGVPPDYVRLRS